MKAQISFVEFLTAMIIFISFAIYISFQVSLFLPSYLNEIRAERLRSEAFQLSELLINDPGHPVNWYKGSFDNAKRVGLSDETKNMTNLLSMVKISSFFSNCSSDYAKTKGKLGADYNFIVILKDNEGNVNSCVPPVMAARAINITMRRIVAFRENGNVKYGELLLQVW